MSLNVVHLGLRCHLVGEAWCPFVSAISPGCPGAAGLFMKPTREAAGGNIPALQLRGGRL